MYPEFVLLLLLPGSAQLSSAFMECPSGECSDIVNTSLQSLNVRLQSLEQSVNQCNRRVEDISNDVQYLMTWKTAQNRLVRSLHGAIKEQEKSVIDAEKRLATNVERAVEIAWEKLYSLQQTAASK
jgi:predicted  nucleic acid-binding Zn-ribbon protein